MLLTGDDHAVWDVEYYEQANGKIPLREFLHSLPIKMRAKAYKEIALLEQLGNEMSMPYSKHMRDGVFELRVDTAGNAARVFYFFFTGKKIILTNGFVKKTQKTPSDELERALTYKADYERRHST